MADHECKERPRGEPAPVYDVDLTRWRLEVRNGAKQWRNIYIHFCPYCGEKL